MGALLAFFLVAAGCSKTSEREVRPWLRVTTKRPRVIAPHVLAIGTHEDIVEMKVGRSWKEIARDPQGVPIFELGDVVMLNTPGGLAPYRADTVSPVLIPAAECPNWAITGDMKRIICAGCGDHPPLGNVGRTVGSDVACPSVTATERALDGQVLWTRHVAWPAIPSSCTQGLSVEPCKLTARGDLLFETHCSDGRPGSGGKRRYFALTESGLQPVPADEPLIPAFQIPGCD